MLQTSNNLFANKNNISNTVNISNVVNSEVYFNKSYTKYISTCYDSVRNNIITAYSDVNNHGYGTVVIGTITNTGIVLSKPVVFNYGLTYDISIVHDFINNRIIIVYRNNSNNQYGTVIVGNITSDNNIVFGKPIVFNASETSHISVAYDYNKNKVIIAYQNNLNDYSGDVIIGIIHNDNNVIFGKPITFSYNVLKLSMAYNVTTEKMIIAYNTFNNNSIYVKVGSILGTSVKSNLKYIKPTVINNVAYDILVKYNFIINKVIMVYNDNNNNGCGTIVIGCILEDDTIKFNKPKVFNSKCTDCMSVIYNYTSNKVIITYNSYDNNINSYNVIEGTISEDDISFSAPKTIENNNTCYASIDYNASNNEVILAYSNVNNHGYGVIKTYSLH